MPQNGRAPLLNAPPILLNLASTSYCPSADTTPPPPLDVPILFGTFNAQLYIGSEVGVGSPTPSSVFIAGITQAAMGCKYTATPIAIGDGGVEMTQPVSDLGAVLDRIVFHHGNILLEVAVYTQGNSYRDIALRYADLLEARYQTAAMIHADLAVYVAATAHY
jgi:hypothetical protein